MSFLKSRTGQHNQAEVGESCLHLGTGEGCINFLVEPFDNLGWYVFGRPNPNPRAVQLDARLPQAHAQLGWVLFYKRQHDAAIAAFERAFALNPNFIDNRFGHILTHAGVPARAIEVLQANSRLDPFQPPAWLGFMGHAYYLLKRYDDAARLLRECVSRFPNGQMPHVYLAAASAQSGQLVEARAEAQEIVRINPGFTIGRRKRLAVYKDPKDAEHFFDGLRKAGLPQD
jgi:adenylate cyclase